MLQRITAYSLAIYQNESQIRISWDDPLILDDLRRVNGFPQLPAFEEFTFKLWNEKLKVARL